MLEQPLEYFCKAAFAIELLQGKWRMQILCIMRTGPVRLGQLTRLIPSASKKVLTENLRKMESAGLVVRTDLSGPVRHVQYDLTETSKVETHLLLDQLAEWATKFGVEDRIALLQSNGSVASEAHAEAEAQITDPNNPKSEPFAFADFTWLTGNARTKDTPYATKFFTPEIRSDANYTYDFRHRRTTPSADRARSSARMRYS